MINTLPAAAKLVGTKVPIAGPDRAVYPNRHLLAAGVLDTVEMRIGVEYEKHDPGEPEDFEDYCDTREADGFGAGGEVTCPGCEEIDEDEVCEWCCGTGIVTVEQWDRWFEANQGCRDFGKNCEKNCKKASCPHDKLRCLLDIPVLVLEARKLDGKWKQRGDSVRGFELKGLVRNPAALLRYLSLVASSLGFDLVCDD
jgi:hypothetical protein